MPNMNPKPAPEAVLREFPPMGKYRIRMVQNQKTKKKALDIREYVSTDDFEGFTRRGIRLIDRTQVDMLGDALRQVLEATDGPLAL